MTARAPLVTPEDLVATLDAPDLRVVDCRFELTDPAAGRALFLAGHIPGACHADLEAHLAGPGDAGRGRHPLPDPDALGEWLGEQGIGTDTRVVCYDADSGAFAARLWWLLRWLGHDAAAVLDGGLAGWTAAGLPLESGEAARREPRPFRARRRDAETWVDVATVAGEPGLLVVDARAPERFRGEHEPIDPVAGHVPGARNRPFPENLDAAGRWRAPAELRADWHRLLGDTPPGRVVHMCGSGVTAAHNLLAMEVAGLSGSRLFPGSWSEWVADPDRPVERGPDR